MMRRNILICLIVVVSVASAAAQYTFTLQPSELRDLDISISGATDEDRIWVNVNMHDLQVLSLVMPLKNTALGMTTYKDYPDNMPVLTCNNRPIYKLINHYYDIDYVGMGDFYDMQQAALPEIDIISMKWDRSPNEIMEYKTMTYDGFNGQLKSSGVTIDTDNCFEFILNYGIEVGEWKILDSIFTKLHYVDHYDNPMELPFVRTKPQNDFTLANAKLKYTLDNQIISLWMAQDSTAFYVKYNIKDNLIDEASLTSPRYSTFISFDNQKMKRSYIKTADENLILQYTKANNIDHAPTHENLVIKRDYNNDGTLKQQEFYFNRNDNYNPELHLMRYSPQREYKKVRKKIDLTQLPDDDFSSDD